MTKADLHTRVFPSQGHPGVKCSHCHAAIGIMAVKKTKEGITFVFGHNTDSFVSGIVHENYPKRHF